MGKFGGGQERAENAEGQNTQCLMAKHPMPNGELIDT